jgi:Uma2 family endonuclease
MPREKVASVAPQLAVEILSESNTVAEIAKKLREYFASGTTLAWVIDLENRIARVHTMATNFTALDATDTLDGGEILPGFRCPLGNLFEEASRRSARKKAP